MNRERAKANLPRATPAPIHEASKHESFVLFVPFCGSLPPSAVPDHDVYVLQQVDVAQHVAADGDDVGVFAFAHGSNLIGDFHGDRGPVGGGADGGHGFDAEAVDPGVELAPGGLAVEVHRDATVGADQ